MPGHSQPDSCSSHSTEARALTPKPGVFRLSPRSWALRRHTGLPPVPQIQHHFPNTGPLQELSHCQLCPDPPHCSVRLTPFYPSGFNSNVTASETLPSTLHHSPPFVIMPLTNNQVYLLTCLLPVFIPLTVSIIRARTMITMEFPTPRAVPGTEGTQ